MEEFKMLNRDVYQKDPSKIKLVNEGVANVNDDTTDTALSVLRYELETFVCEGQYEKGLEHILDTYLKNVNQAQQPGVWVSGFYGSGKSHLIKMLRALWINTKFNDGATARGITGLTQNISDHLKELDTQAKRFGGLHAASGTLGAGASGSVRIALLRILFKSVGLPEQYHLANFVLWLKSQGIFNTVKSEVEQNGFRWEEELDNFHVAEGLHTALVKCKPSVFPSSDSCLEWLMNNYPKVSDISSDEMLKAINKALSKDDKFPLTLIALDEVQQYIGEDSQKAMAVQETVEACCKNFAGKLLFIGTGQTAITGTPNLKKLEGRFTVRIELSDTDVDSVIRKVILAKKADAISDIKQMMQTNLGEISRHLAGTTIGHRQDDIEYFSQDYPILPVRRRFWENTLRVLDQTGTESQLRNQLSMVHKVIRTNLDQPLGNVVPADYLYFDSADKLLQARILPRKIHEKTIKWINGSDDEKLTARACGLIFLINKLAGFNKEIGVKANIHTVADLMVQDIVEGSTSLRNKMPGLLDNCEILMKVGDEYRIQTEESQAWNDAFFNQKSQLANELHRIDAERNDRIRKKFSESTRRLSLTQGASKIPRDFSLTFDAVLPTDSNQKIYIWVRDGWNTDEANVIADARQAGNNSPAIFVFIPKRSADDLRRHLIEYKSANSTLEIKGVPATPEGIEARAAMETIKQTAEGRINELLDDAFSGIRIFQGGGNEIIENNLQAMLSKAAQNSLQRLYPQFSIADNDGWGKVYTKAKEGAPDSLKAVGHDSDVGTNNVCKNILNFIGGSKKGEDIRKHFTNSPFGWPQDSIDGTIQALLVAGLVHVNDERGQPVDPMKLERKSIGKSTFKVESITLSAKERIEIRKLFQKINIKATSGEELSVMPQFLQELKNLADNAGGEAPKPELPDIRYLEEIRLISGNEQLLALYNQKDLITQDIDKWNSLKEKIDKRLPLWQTLQSLLKTAKDATEIKTQVQEIEQQRLLLNEPDPISPLISEITQFLRDELNKLNNEYKTNYDKHITRLSNDSNWIQLDKNKQDSLLKEYKLTESEHPNINTQSSEDILKTLDIISLSMFSDRIAAIPERVNELIRKAAKLLEPEVQFIELPKKTLRTEADIKDWIEEAEKKLKNALNKGPVAIK